MPFLHNCLSIPSSYTSASPMKSAETFKKSGCANHCLGKVPLLTQPKLVIQPRSEEEEEEMQGATRFAVRTSSSSCSSTFDCRARAGTLRLGSISAETPCLLLSTMKGLPHFITPDLFHSLPHNFALQFSPLHFLDIPSSHTVTSLGGVHSMLGLHDYGLIAVLRDSKVCIPDAVGSYKAAASFDTPFGRRKVKPVQYMENIWSLKPDLWISLPDEVPSWVSEKRNRISVDRTLNWLDECLSIHPTFSDSLLGAVMGANNLEERRRSATEVARRNVAGFWLGGFGMGENIDDRRALLVETISALPEEKPRHISGLESPEEILQGVEAGVDIFDSTYPYHLTVGGYAITFPLDMEGDYSSRNALDVELSEIGSDSSKINLRAKVYRNDSTPIMDDCDCYTCQRHTKAYIHHLLNTHEMLAQTLLELHNTHHFLKFFQTIRSAIHANNFKSFRSWFFKKRREHFQ